MASPIWCRRCGQHTTPANREIVWDRNNSGWRAQHNDCPPNPHNPDGRPTWGTWDVGAGRLPQGLAPGRVLTLSWQEQEVASAEMPDVVAAKTWPGAGVATATAPVMVVEVHQIKYDRDGRSFGADSDAGSAYWAVVRRP
jgi:hypothetical protein